MNKLICLGVVCVGWICSAPAQDKAAAPAVTVFQIGVADGDYHEFALAGNFQSYAQTSALGDEVLVALEETGRHFGHKIQETILEK